MSILSKSIRGVIAVDDAAGEDEDDEDARVVAAEVTETERELELWPHTRGIQAAIPKNVGTINMTGEVREKVM